MLIQLTIGTLLITLTVIIQVIMLGSLATLFNSLESSLLIRYKGIKNTALMGVSVLWLVLGITINTWIWAFTFILIGEFQQLETALYFAIASFTTLGYGDVLVSQQWRILGSLSAVNGLIVFGLNTAFLVELMMATWGKFRRKS